MANRSRQTRVCRHGFTLIELLVAISILAVVAVMSWRGLDSITRARQALNEDLAQTRSMQISFAQLQTDCAQLAARSTIGNMTPIHIDKNRLILIRMHYADQQAGRLHVVVYRLDNGILTRQESVGTRDLSTIAAFWRSALGDINSSSPLTLQSGLASMRLLLWDSRSLSWRDTYPSTIPGPFINNAMQPSIDGLEVRLFQIGKEIPIVKVMLLGAAS